jgi:hypothetical protein
MMARFFGAVGYGESVETPAGSGVWVDAIQEIEYYGDIVRTTRRLDSGENLNSDIEVNNSISIVADEYAINHFFKIKYIRWAGALWAVANVESRPPRLILSLGSVYNGPTA